MIIQLGGGSLTDISFREIGYPPMLCKLLLFPPDPQIRDSAPQEFALQFWDDHKVDNTSLLIGIMGTLLTSKGNNVRLYHSSPSPSLTATFLRRRSLRLLFFSRDRISFKFPYSPKNTSAFTMPLILTTSSFANVYPRHFTCFLQISTSPSMR